ncbi:DUF4886 domain-containing protein [Parablastomonas sp. CN1-191]|uniref:DUF4886 domain-containing protein n=1 Tax=Parablastomonas sp. CN1-191 TaxID=3400908 RepID=UPI003BF7AB6C
MTTPPRALAAVLAAACLTVANCAPAAPPASTPAAVAAPLQVLFVGNSFTQGAHSAVRNWRADTVTDLAGGGYGGVPALVNRFAAEADRPMKIALETQGGKSLAFHLAERRELIDRRWDVVVLQEFSTLDAKAPGNPASTIAALREIVALLKARNPAVRIYLMATWSRADLVYQPGKPWSGKPIEQMALDLRAASDRAVREVPGIAGIIPVGQAFNRAMAGGVADPNPYDGIAPGQLDLWTYDHYHASVAGYYLEALVTFGLLTGIDPASLGAAETAADELGLSDDQAKALQAVARAQLAAG